MEDKKPVLALNLYLEPYFRKEIIQEVYGNLAKLDPEDRSRLVEKTKETVHVSGFRNPLQAPVPMLVRAAEKVFEKDAFYLAPLLTAWRSLHADEAEKFGATWKNLGFEALEPSDDPEKAFAQDWPEGMTYQSLEDKLREANPITELDGNRLALLTILNTGYLPGDAAGKE